MKAYLFYLLLLFLFPQANAEVEVIDGTGKIFESIGFWTPGLPFEEAFNCGDSANYSATVSNCTYKCNDQYCMSQCSEATTFPRFNYFVEDCTEGQVFIYGENGFAARVTRADYERAGNNWLIALLKAHPHFIQPTGKVVLKMTIPRMISLIKNGRKQTVRGSQVMGEIYSGNTRQGFTFEAFVLPGEKGLHQIAYFRADFEDIFMKLKGVINDRVGGL